jgi:MoxR-like ATPase
MYMKILIANIAWIDNGWTGLDNQTLSGHKYVKDGGIAHESLNFKFDGEWNDHEHVYGFFQSTNPPQIEGDKNIIIFYSNKKIVGVYNRVEYGNFRPVNKPHEINQFNLRADRSTSFKLDNFIEFNEEKHLPDDKKRIGQIGFTYIGNEQLVQILDEMLEKNFTSFYEIEQIKKDIGIQRKFSESWDDFIKTIDFEKINLIKKQVKDENLEEGLRVFSFLSDFRDKLPTYIKSLSTFSRGKNSHPTQPQWSNENGFRVGFYYGDKNYMPATQLNITIGARWGGGIFIKDNKNLIFGNIKIHEYLKNTFPELNFNEQEKHIGAIWFKNNIHELPSEKDVLIAVKKLSVIFEIMKKGEYMDKLTRLLVNQYQIILQGPPGTGKTRLAKMLANFMIDGSMNSEIDGSIKDRVKLIQFHPSYSYEDFVRGIVAKSNGTQIEYKVENKVLALMAKDAYIEYQKDKENAKPFVLIIDEINRANLSTVLGELIYALEYRGEPVESMYSEENDGNTIILPPNLYIIGTMNTADRSIGHIDYAIRRRFSFINVLPDESVVHEQSKFRDVLKIFDEHLSPEFKKENVMLGHSYFIADNESTLETKLQYQVLPLLKEYLSDGILLESAREIIQGLEKD